MLQCDNTRPHTSRETTAHLAKLKVQLAKQSPNSPDLNMCNRFLFRKIKSGMKHSSFNGPEDVDMAVRPDPGIRANEGIRKAENSL